jgi:hypothetical protein
MRQWRIDRKHEHRAGNVAVAWEELRLIARETALNEKTPATARAGRAWKSVSDAIS